MTDNPADPTAIYPYDYDPIVTDQSRLVFAGPGAGVHLHLDLYLPSEAMTADLVAAFTNTDYTCNGLSVRLGHHIALAVREWKDAQPNV